MARKPRLHVPGGFYHVMLRGNAGQDIFFADADRRQFYRLLREGSRRFDYRVHGFCLMRNHVHLVVQVAETALSRPMQNLSFRYSAWVNRRQARSGHLFQGRYKALLVDADSYLLALVRYVHLNPVRAGLVRTAEDYSWSGHRAYLGLETLPWLTTAWVLGQFGRHVEGARAAYRAYVRDGAGEGHREEFHRGRDDSRVLADDRFLEAVLGRPGPPPSPPSLQAIVAHVCADYRVGERDLAGASRRRLLAEARGVVGYLALRTGAATLSAIAGRYNRDLTTMSRTVRRVERRQADDSDFAARLRAHVDTFMQA